MALEDRFEVMKEIGDGSFGSVVLARVRTAGAHVARRGTMVSSIYIFQILPVSEPLQDPANADMIVILGCNQDHEEDF